MDVEKNIFILTGAGISKESGIQTFREKDGLWDNHRIEDVCTVDAFLRNPTFTSSDQENVFKYVSKKLKQPQYLHNTICLMIRKGRGYDLVNFSEDFLKLCSVSKNELIVRMTTAKKVSDIKIEEIKRSIEKITKRVVRLEAENDPNIIAGLELKVGSFLFNSSINSKLDSMKNILKRG